MASVDSLYLNRISLKLNGSEYHRPMIITLSELTRCSRKTMRILINARCIFVLSIKVCKLSLVQPPERSKAVPLMDDPVLL